MTPCFYFGGCQHDPAAYGSIEGCQIGARLAGRCTADLGGDVLPNVMTQHVSKLFSNVRTVVQQGQQCVQIGIGNHSLRLMYILSHVLAGRKVYLLRTQKVHHVGFKKSSWLLHSEYMSQAYMGQTCVLACRT
eukprot:jgi/Ulvmu1/7618/UM038_0043.1